MRAMLTHFGLGVGRGVSNEWYMEIKCFKSMYNVGLFVVSFVS